MCGMHRRATDAVVGQLIPGLKKASSAILEAFAELSRRMANLNQHMTGGAPREGFNSSSEIVDVRREGSPDRLRRLLPIVEAIGSPLPFCMDYEQIQLDAEAVIEQVRWRM